jgi:RNA polymerase sigma factor (TIGR02999 family)
MAEVSSCPDVVALQWLMVGLVSDQEAESLEGHVAECQRCLATLTRLEMLDGLVDRLRGCQALAAALSPCPAVCDLMDRVRKLQPPSNDAPMKDVTRILCAIAQGESDAAEQLLPLVYDGLRKLATQKLAGEKPGQTLQATALVHDAYLRLVDAKQPLCWNSRGHFFGAAAEAMRRILVDDARRKKAGKHSGLAARVAMETAELPKRERDDLVLALDEALAKLEKQDRAKGQLVKLRWFAALTIQETAAFLGLSTASANRSWTYARAWLQREMQANGGDPHRG